MWYIYSATYLHASINAYCHMSCVRLAVKKSIITVHFVCLLIMYPFNRRVNCYICYNMKDINKYFIAASYIRK